MVKSLIQTSSREKKSNTNNQLKNWFKKVMKWLNQTAANGEIINPNIKHFSSNMFLTKMFSTENSFMEMFFFFLIVG
jgi:hypothetical protein